MDDELSRSPFGGQIGQRSQDYIIDASRGHDLGNPLFPCGFQTIPPGGTALTAHDVPFDPGLVCAQVSDGDGGVDVGGVPVGVGSAAGQVTVWAVE